MDKVRRIAINGFGRIGRLFFRQVWEDPRLEIIAINDLGDLDNLAYLLKYDSVYRTFPGDIRGLTRTETRLPAGRQGTTRNYLMVDGKEILMIQEKDPAKLPWGDLKVDLVVESTGVFESFEKSKAHLDAGAKKVVITAPTKDADGTMGGKTILMGVNDDELKNTTLSSNASCTTNGIASAFTILSESLGIKKAVLNTIHAYTNTQTMVDSQVKGSDFRRGRAGAQNLIPSTTGAAVALTRIMKDMTGKFDGVAIRVPVITGSLADVTFLAGRKTTAEEVNDILRKAAKTPRWRGILGVSDEQIVSSDIIGEPVAAIADAKFTKVVDGDLVKIMLWYDNEWGYVVTLVNHVLKAAESL